MSLIELLTEDEPRQPHHPSVVIAMSGLVPRRIPQCHASSASRFPMLSPWLFGQSPHATLPRAGRCDALQERRRPCRSYSSLSSTGGQHLQLFGKCLRQPRPMSRSRHGLSATFGDVRRRPKDDGATLGSRSRCYSADASGSSTPSGDGNNARTSPRITTTSPSKPRYRTIEQEKARYRAGVSASGLCPALGRSPPSQDEQLTDALSTSHSRGRAASSSSCLGSV